MCARPLGAINRHFDNTLQPGGEVKKMFWENSLYLIAIAAPPILLGFTWWKWFSGPRIQIPEWRRMLFVSGLCAGTLNVVLFWAWVVWLHFHYNPASWRVQDIVGDAGLYLLLYSIIAATAGKGRYRLMLGISNVLSLLPWIPHGVL